MTAAPNLFGDFLGGRGSQTTIPSQSPGALNGGTVVASIPQSNLSPGSTPGTLTGNLRNASLGINGPNGQTIFSSLPFALAYSRGGGQFTETTPVPTRNAPLFNSVFSYLSTPGTGGTLTVPPGTLSAADAASLRTALGPLQGSTYQLAALYEKTVNPSAMLTQFKLGGVQALYTGSELEYISQISSTVTTPLVINVPNPGLGGSVGLVKLSEDNNPLPRDRVIFNYDYFSNTPLAAGGIPVNRYQFGFEKTFLDGWTSFEVRMTFASTIDHDLVEGDSTRNTEFGNLRLASKTLLYRGDAVNVSTGLGIYLPTANSVNVQAMDGTQLVHISNSSVQLAPFLAVLYTPNPRLFAQAWVSWTFDTGGNGVQVNPNFFNGSEYIGSLRAPTEFSADAQLGYWLLRSNSGLVRGLAPFVELHYDGYAGRGTVLTAGNSGFQIGDTGSSVDEFNISAGAIALLGQNTTLTVGGAAPLRSAPNRTFDYQIGVRLSWYFGRSARDQSPGARVNAF